MPLMALRHKRLPTCPVEDPPGAAYDQLSPTPNCHGTAELANSTAGPTAPLDAVHGTRYKLRFTLNIIERVQSPKSWSAVGRDCVVREAICSPRLGGML